MKKLSSVVAGLLVAAASVASPVHAQDAAKELIGDPKAIVGTLDPGKTRETGVKATAAAEKIGWRIGSQAYTLRDRTLTEALDTLHVLGLKYVECYPGQSVSPEMKNVKFQPGLSAEGVALVKKKLEQTGIKVLSFGVTGIPAKEEEARALFQFCKDFGMERIVTEAGAGQFDMMQKLAEEFDIDVALHNHPEPNIYGTPEKVLAAIKPNHTRIGACADVGHWQRSNVDPVEGLKKLEGKVYESHFKDLNEFGVKKATDVPWGTGNGNAKGMLAELHRQAGKTGGKSGKMTFNLEYETGRGVELVGNMHKCIEWFGQQCEELAAKK
jgi:sugar phosphate isomerase/epimerase